MDISCVVTGQDERGKSAVFVPKKPIEPVSLAQFPGCISARPSKWPKR